MFKMIRSAIKADIRLRRESNVELNRRLREATHGVQQAAELLKVAERHYNLNIAAIEELEAFIKTLDSGVLSLGVPGD